MPVQARKVIHDEQCKDNIYALMQHEELTNSHDPLEESAFNVTHKRHNPPKAFRIWRNSGSPILYGTILGGNMLMRDLYVPDRLKGIALDIRRVNTVRNGSSAVVPWSSRQQSRESGLPGKSGYMYSTMAYSCDI